MKVSYANRGMAFEQVIEYTNKQYALKGWAVIEKVPTPWQVIRRGKQIISAFPEKKSTVDFMGVAGGQAIAFDAKSTRERTRFPLSNIESHQLDFLKSFHEQGGKAFFLIEFAKLHEIYLVTYQEIMEYWEKSKVGERKSIPHHEMTRFPLVKSERGVALDYLKLLHL